MSKIFIDEENKRKELGKYIMKSFWTQSLHGTGIVCPKQINYQNTLLNRQRHGKRVNQYDGKAAELSGVVSEMIKTAGEAGIEKT